MTVTLGPRRGGSGTPSPLGERDGVEGAASPTMAAAAMTISLIAAIARQRVIGRDNRLPWHLPADLAHFKRLTLDKPIIMGRRTWESLPGPLPRRHHILLTRNPDYQAAGCAIVASPEAALAAAAGAREVMVIGGASVYRLMLPLAERLYLTEIAADIDGDSLFPDWDPNEWRVLTREERPRDARNPYDLAFVTRERIRALGQAYP